MIYHIAYYLKSIWSFFNVVHYVSFRAMAALLSSIFFSFLFGQQFIETSKRFFRSKAREWTPSSHRAKDNMPTMGGLFILAIVTLNILLWCNWYKTDIWIFLGCLIGFGAIGFYDDWAKIKHGKGMSAGLKFKLQVFISAVTIFLFIMNGLSTTVSFPFVKWLMPDISWFYLVWAVFIIVGCSNAVNLTDGLDGLAITSLIPNFVIFSILCYLAGHYKIAHYLHIPFAGSAEITVIGATLVGASIGFLWYNAYPAQIFMGDVGSLALGSGLALMALLSKQEILLSVSGGLFVIEALSVITQVGSYKLFGKKIFRMAPIHHHFELLGWPESKITARFGIISLILCLLALMTIKMR
ncbi:MAG: phospho-N-acetylmuramoyl-pentapeptide-transferase [Candidatus Babeliales bacterium]